jgi:hypothetical protein
MLTRPWTFQNNKSNIVSDMQIPQWTLTMEVYRHKINSALLAIFSHTHTHTHTHTICVSARTGGTPWVIKFKGWNTSLAKQLSGKLAASNRKEVTQSTLYNIIFTCKSIFRIFVYTISEAHLFHKWNTGCFSFTPHECQSRGRRNLCLVKMNWRHLHFGRHTLCFPLELT